MRHKNQLARAMEDMRDAMNDMGLHCNEKMCAVTQVKAYKFLRVLEDIGQEVSLALENVENFF